MRECKINKEIKITNSRNTAGRVSQPWGRPIVVGVALWLVPVAESLVLRFVQLRLPLLGDRGLAEETLAAVQEHPIEETVDNEIGGSIYGQKGVRELPDTLDQVAGFRVAQSKHGGHDGIGRYADQKDEDDNDHHQRHPVARVALLVGSRLAEGADDAGVENDEDDERDDRTEEILGPVVAQDEGLVLPHLCQFHLQHDDQGVGVHTFHRLVPAITQHTSLYCVPQFLVGTTFPAVLLYLTA